ncbi:MOSC domain-containing protein [Acetobacter orientalis]|uniref:MOSC domain-containing protein n=1 Tax=Acetobacter orientalis TaxID=146474 RepID=UPI0039E7597B
MSFADGFPLLITTTASLEDLNRCMDTPVPMTRFRPNITFSGCATGSEDTWRLIWIGTCLIRVVKPCARCAVTLVDQTTGKKPIPREPLRTLAAFRSAQRGDIRTECYISLRKEASGSMTLSNCSSLRLPNWIYKHFLPYPF